MKNLKLWRNLFIAITITFLLGIIFSLWNLNEQGELFVNNAGNGGSCLTCHNRATPGVIEQYGTSEHAASKVACIDCHRGEIGVKSTINHYDNELVVHPTPTNCSRCHPAQATQFDHSRHSAPAWYAQTGATAFTDEQLERYGLDKVGKYNDLFQIEGPDVTKMGCQVCHGIGRPNEDGSFGDCAKCHVGHNFSKGTVRKPEICGSCHLGPDHPMKEIYEESIHGVFYEDSGRDNWDWEAETISSKNFDAPTCSICHMSAFGAAPGTHDVGQRLSWVLTPAIAYKRTNWEARRVNMQSVCVECHSESFVKTHYENSDKVILAANDNVKKAQTIIKDLKDDGLIPKEPFASTIDFKGFEIWHHEGRRMRFGAVMNGPDYVQWHGIYEQLIDLTELKEWDAELRTRGGHLPSTQSTSKSTTNETR